MTDYEELIEQLRDRLDYFGGRMAMAGRALQFEPIIEPEEGAWAFLDLNEWGSGGTLRVHPSLPEELIDWVIVRALAELMVYPLRDAAQSAVAALAVGPSGGRDEGPTEADCDRGDWRGRIGNAEERVVQRICDAVLRRQHTFLVNAWFAMLCYED